MRKSSFVGMVSFLFACVLNVSSVLERINNKFPKAVYNGFICCFEKNLNLMLSVILHNWISSVTDSLKVLRENYY